MWSEISSNAKTSIEIPLQIGLSHFNDTILAINTSHVFQIINVFFSNSRET